MLVTVQCEQCNREFETERSRVNRRLREHKLVFCSRSCGYASRNTTVTKECKFCKKFFSSALKREQQYCSHSCRAKQINPTRAKIRHCLFCKKETKNYKFCNHSCQHEYSYTQFVSKWLDGKESGVRKQGLTYCSYIKRYLQETEGNKCKECGWCQIHNVTGKVPVQLDHINGNSEDNSRDNVRLLCPNCHSLTPTYGILNKGKGRKLRYAPIV